MKGSIGVYCTMGHLGLLGLLCCQVAGWNRDDGIVSVSVLCFGGGYLGCFDCYRVVGCVRQVRGNAKWTKRDCFLHIANIMRDCLQFLSLPQHW